MDYNPFTEMRKGTFSFKRDYEITNNRLNNILIDAPSKFLGNLPDKKAIVDIRELYLIGGTLELMGLTSFLSGDVELAKAAAIGGLISMVVAPVHHYAMGSKFSQ